ncbi:MAG TPA: outer membrane beta-barrel protein [Pirellulales bacterium]
MRADRKTTCRKSRSLGGLALAILALVFATGAIRIAAADDSLPDHRRTASGKPLLFRAADVSLDRDDQAAATDADDQSAAQAQRTAQPADAPELLAPERPKSASMAADGRAAGRNAAATSAGEQEPTTTTARATAAPRQVPSAPGDGSRPSEPLPSGPHLGPPSPGFNAADLGRTDLANGPPSDCQADPSGGPRLPPHGDLPGGVWPHGYLRQQLEEPLVGASWCNEPYHIDWFLGAIRGTEIIRNHVDQNVGVIGGFRLGWDYDIYWGLETRLGFSALEDQPETAPLEGSSDKVILWDSSLVYYPWGDSRWRPYISFGLGLCEFRFTDDLDRQIQRNLMELPLGIGMKYRLHDWLSLRAEVTDNLALGSSGLATMNNFSFTTGMEFRFGGAHRSYWPWEPAAAH